MGVVLVVPVVVVEVVGEGGCQDYLGQFTSVVLFTSCRVLKPRVSTRRRNRSCGKSAFPQERSPYSLCAVPSCQRAATRANEYSKKRVLL